MSPLPRGISLRRDAGLYARERALHRHGLAPVAGIDEAGRGACAGPLVVAAVVLREGAEIKDLADSKLLGAGTREVVYERIVRRAQAWSAVVIPAGEVDRTGLHVANIAGMRRALARLGVRPGYVLTDGFPVSGLGVPGLALWKGDQVSASIAAASVVAKVTRDRIMRDLHETYPHYDFATHKGYVTAAHQQALELHGASEVHRFSYVNVRRVTREPVGADA